MNVKLIASTPEPDKLVATAARLCYSPLRNIIELQEKLTDEQIQKLVGELAKMGHHSPLEHCTFTFAIEGISRACSHQLVRHRIASYSQRSQRYVKENQFEYVIPANITGNLADEYRELMVKIQLLYDKMVFSKVPKEDARYILPNACETKIIVSMNARSLMNFFARRCCSRAQWEIRDLAWKMLEICKEVAPLTFINAGPDCVRGFCNEGRMSCKNE